MNKTASFFWMTLLISIFRRQQHRVAGFLDVCRVSNVTRIEIMKQKNFFSLFGVLLIIGLII